MSRHVVLGAGPIGRTITELLLSHGHEVTVVTRSGTEVQGAGSVALAGADPRLAQVLDGAASLVVATNPPYEGWDEQWPPLIANAVAAAESASADLVLIGNLYAHAPRTSPMTAQTPLEPTTRKGAVRARMWQDLLAAHTAGRVRVTEIRASDYCGPQSLATESAHIGKRFVEPLLAGRTARVIGDPDVLHSWTAVDDIAATAVAVLSSDQAWGRPWVVPTAPARSLRQVAEDIVAEAGIATATVRMYPRWLIGALGLAMPMMRELVEVLYQHRQEFVCDGSETTEVLGVAATPWSHTIATTVAAAQGRHVAPSGSVHP